MIDSHLAVVVVAVAGLATPAAADPPRVDLARCTAFDAKALRNALARELPPSGGTTPFAVIVACPDLVTANLHVEPVPADGPIARSLDLGEVPGDLRVKLLALAIAELAEVAATLPPPTGETPKSRSAGDPRDPTSLADADPKTRTRADPKTGAHVEPKATARVEPKAGTRIDSSSHSDPNTRRVESNADHDPNAGRDPNGPSAGHRDPNTRTIDPRVAVSDASITRDTADSPNSRRPPVELGATAGVRVFTSAKTPLLDLAVELSLPWFRVGARGGVGQARDVLGTLHPWLATATCARELVCMGPGCALVRGEVGMAGVIARAATSATAANASSAYAQGSLAVEVRHRFAGWTAMAAVDAGYAGGMRARAADRTVLTLAGFVTSAGVGARW